MGLLKGNSSATRLELVNDAVFYYPYRYKEAIRTIQVGVTSFKALNLTLNERPWVTSAIVLRFNQIES
jgi:hypothetical protein